MSTDSSNDPTMPDPTPTAGDPDPTPAPTAEPATAANLVIGNWFVSTAAQPPNDGYEPNDAQAKFLGGAGFLYTLTQGYIEPIEAVVTAEITNAGDAGAGAFAADLFLGKTAPPAAGERGVMTQNVPALAIGETATIAFTLRGGAQASTLQAAVKADAAGALTEADEADNFSSNVGVMLPKADEDWFSFDEASGQTIQVRLMNLPADYDVELYYQNGARVAQSATDGTAAENISYTTTVSGRWYVRVFGYQGAASDSAPYRLEITVP